MKKILLSFLCLLALTACESSENTPAAQNETGIQNVTEAQASAETEISSETNPSAVHNNGSENPPSNDERRDLKGNIIRVTSVDGNVITGEKMWGGRGFGGGRPDGNAPSFDGEMPDKEERPEGAPPAMPEDGSRPGGEMPDKPEKGDNAPNGERPQGETVTFNITDSTVMDMETISEGDMIIAEINEDGTASSVKPADFAKAQEETTST